MAWLFLALSLVGAWLTYNVYRPVFAHKVLSSVSFLAGWITGEMALHWIVAQALVSAGLIAAGALAGPAGMLAAGITVVSWGFMARAYFRAHEAAPVLKRALAEDGIDVRPDWRRAIQPFPLRRPEVERITRIKYHRERGVDLHLDLYRGREGRRNCPVLLQIHGGAWIFGSRTNQGLPLMHHLAARGWVCVSVDYRLSPHATFPDHLIDCKRAVQWIREHVADYGGDPNFIVVTGGSAGGHLCSLVALTANDPEYQPGFEEVDTRVNGCVPFYGVYDFADRHDDIPHTGLAELLERSVMKASLEEAPEAYDKASPLARITSDAPPFFVVHGDADTLAPVATARRFVEALREKSPKPVRYAEIPGAQHAFELFYSLRSVYVVQAVAQYCESLHRSYQADG
jgi:acetyl esterase/lipase